MCTCWKRFTVHIFLILLLTPHDKSATPYEHNDTRNTSFDVDTTTDALLTSVGNITSGLKISPCFDPAIVQQNSLNWAFNEGIGPSKKCKNFSCSKRCGQVGTKLICQCDDVCWLHGDCCEDFYSECLSISINESQDALLEATLSKYSTNYSRVVRFVAVKKWVALSSCVGTGFLKIVMVTQCGRDEETLKNFAKMYEKINAVESNDLQYFKDTPMEDIILSCQEPSKDPYNTKEKHPLLYTQMMYMEIDLKLYFFNVYCGICNGFDPLSMTSAGALFDCGDSIKDLTVESQIHLQEVISNNTCRNVYSFGEFQDDTRVCVTGWEKPFSPPTNRDTSYENRSSREDFSPSVMCRRYYGAFSLNDVDPETKLGRLVALFWNEHCYDSVMRSAHLEPGLSPCLGWFFSCSLNTQGLFTTLTSFRVLFDFRKRMFQVKIQLNQFEKRETVFPEILALKNKDLIRCGSEGVEQSSGCYQEVHCSGRDVNSSLCDFRRTLNSSSLLSMKSYNFSVPEIFAIDIHFKFVNASLQSEDDISYENQLPKHPRYLDQQNFYLRNVNFSYENTYLHQDNISNNFTNETLGFYNSLLEFTARVFNQHKLNVTKSVMCFNDDAVRCLITSDGIRKIRVLNIEAAIDYERESSYLQKDHKQGNKSGEKVRNRLNKNANIFIDSACDIINSQSNLMRDAVITNPNTTNRNYTGETKRDPLDKTSVCFSLFFTFQKSVVFNTLNKLVKHMSTTLASDLINERFLLERVELTNSVKQFPTSQYESQNHLECSSDRKLEEYIFQSDRYPSDLGALYLDNYELPNSGRLLFIAEYNTFMNSIQETKLQRLVIPLCVQPLTFDTCPHANYIRLKWNEFFIFRGELILPLLNDGEIEDGVTFIKKHFDLFIHNDNLNLSQVILGFKQMLGNDTFRIVSKQSYILTGQGAFICSTHISGHLVDQVTNILASSSDVEYYCTIVSSIVSIVSLLLVFLVYWLLPELRSNVPGKIVLSMSLSLLVAHILFLFNNVPRSLACEIFASFHHAAWMSSFVWLAFMSVHLAYTLYYKPVELTGSKVFYSTSAVCWCFPILVAGVCFLLDKLDYVTIEYGKYNDCWIGNHKAAIIVFGIPVIVCLFLSLISLAVIISLIRKSVAFRHLSSSEYRGGSRHFLICLNLTLLMALRCVCYFIALFTEVPSLWIVYVLAHGCQGLFVFLCFVARKSIVLKLVFKWRGLNREN